MIASNGAVFMIETKSHRGKVTVQENVLLVNGRAPEKDFIARQPMGRLATVDDITPMVVFLLSDESRFVSGQAMLVDGGVTI